MFQISDTEFITLTSFIKKNYGIDLAKKRVLIEGRLSNMLLNRGISSFKEYMDIVFNDKSATEITTLLNKLTTNFTFFLREAEHFDFMANQVLPYLEKSSKTRDLRIWSSACSSGEEPYSMAMVIDEYFGSQKPEWDAKILATDISMNVLEKAKLGIYTEESVDTLPPHWKKKYFVDLKNGTYQVCERIRNEVIFSPFNLMDDFKFKKKFDLIFCRNVMIYFDAQTKDKLIDKFFDYTESGGFLFIGHSESINKAKAKYTYIKPAIYRKGMIPNE